MKAVLGILILFMSSGLSGQTSNKDSIDFSLFGGFSLNKYSYCLVKIKDEKPYNEKTFDGKDCFFRINNMNENVLNLRSILNTDTVVSGLWDQGNRSNEYSFDPHEFAKMHLNKANNLIILEKYKGKSKPAIFRKFKVLKWTLTELILYDWLNLKTYYFKCNPRS
jgi:hypothetical protein